MAQPSGAQSRQINPLLRYLPLLAIFILIWPLSGQDIDVFGLTVSTAVIGAVFAVLGGVFGTLAARSR